jgi:hypothetical protein
MPITISIIEEFPKVEAGCGIISQYVADIVPRIGERITFLTNHPRFGEEFEVTKVTMIIKKIKASPMFYDEMLFEIQVNVKHVT